MDRLELLRNWVAQQHPGRAFSLSPASADASFRRYFRASFDDGGPSLIVMDAPPSHEDCKSFVKVARLFGASGAHVPEVLAENHEYGFLLLTDLGSTTYLQALNADNAAHLYADALGALASIQRSSQPGVLPEYSRELLMRELELFPVWYIARHKGVTLSDAETADLYEVFDRILEVNLAEPKVFVHRDYHSRNLMHLPAGNPGVLDFQDAVYGPITYDLASLFKDAYIEWDEELTLDWLVRYWEVARTLGLPVREDFAEFHRDYEWMGAQRHIKVLGIFARLCYRDGKDAYLQSMPLVMRYLRKTAERYRELKPLARLLDKLDPVEKVEGLTF